MTKQIRTTLLTGLFFFGLLTGLQAQDKYEYAVIDYIPYTKTIEISINGTDYREIKVPKEKVKGNGDTNAALEELNKMIDQGWELFNTSIANGASSQVQIFVYYLRKKKN